MTEWKTKKVGELADTQLGKMLNKGKQSGKHAKPYLRTDNVHWGSFDLSEIKEMDILPDEENKYLATKGDLLMCEGGASGRTAIWNEDYDISFQNHVHRIRPKDPKEITPKYLLYFFEWFIKNGFANDLIKGVTISSLSQSGLRSIEVNYPPLPEQQKIVEILEDHLSRLDAALADVKQAKLKAAQFRRSLLQAAFTGNLSGDGTGLMNELPDGWVWTTIGEVCEKPKYGWTTSASDIGEVKLLRTTDLTHGPITWETVPFCKEIPKKVADYLVHPNDIFISRAGSVGVSVLVKDAPFKSVFASYLIRIRPTKKIYSKYLSLFLQSPHYWNQVTELSSGIALANINATKIQSMNLPLPPLSEQQKIVELLEDHLSRLDASVAIADAMEKQSSSLRRSLLQAAFTGQLTKEVASV